MKTLFTRPVKPCLLCNNYSSMYCYFECWMEGSVGCDVLGKIAAEQEHLNFLGRGFERPHSLFGEF